MALVKLQKTIEKYGEKGEKTSWTYVIIDAKYAAKLSPGSRISFRIKGKLDSHPIKGVSILPIGKGAFILPLNAALRKILKKKQGDELNLQIELDPVEPTLSNDLMRCLKDDRTALAFFKSLPRSHQHYFSKWIESAKTISTRAKRIAMTVSATSLHQGFGEMMRANKNQRN